MAAAALPLILKATSTWLGQDGNWSTWALSVGTPPQTFNILPSTIGGSIWVPAPQACQGLGSNCAVSRGIGTSSGIQSTGFSTDNSSTWNYAGLYQLGLEAALFPGDPGLFGQDTISLDNGGRNITSQTVAGISTADFWLGVLGLGYRADQIGSDAAPPTLLWNLKTMNMTPSLSYGFSAGAAWRSAPGGLVIGGYDQNAFAPSNVSFPAQLSAGTPSARALTVILRSGLAANTPLGTIAMQLPGGGINMSIDSTVSQMWLPTSLCEQLAQNLGLTYDSGSQLYLVNSTARSQLLQYNPSLTFTLGSNDPSSPGVNIQLPYKALDMQIGLGSHFDNETYYFPIRRAANETQYVFGRAFLQEAYLVVDWERQNFTLGQATRTSGGVSNNIKPILTPGQGGDSTSSPAEPHATSTSSGGGTSVGAIAGGVIAGVVALGVAGVLGWWCMRKRKLQKTEPNFVRESSVVEYYSGGKDKDDANKNADSDVREVGVASPPPGYTSAFSPKRLPAEFDLPEGVHELHTDARYETMSNPVFELAGHVVEHEMSSSGPERDLGLPFSPDAVIQPIEAIEITDRIERIGSPDTATRLTETSKAVETSESSERTERRSIHAAADQS